MSTEYVARVLLDRVTSGGGATADASQMHPRTLCSVQAVKSAMQALVNLEVLVEASAVLPSSRKPLPHRTTSLPASLVMPRKDSLHKRSDSATRLPSYDSVQSLQTLEQLAEETKVPRATCLPIRVRSSTAPGVLNLSGVRGGSCSVLSATTQQVQGTW